MKADANRVIEALSEQLKQTNLELIIQVAINEQLMKEVEELRNEECD